MNNDLFFYDPLFGVILLISIILVIILADYGRNLLRAKQKKNNLKEFVQSYKEGSLSDEVAEFFALSKNPLSALLFLANTHNRAGDSNAAIKLYLGILKEVTNDADKMIILEELGETYFKAGFLERAKTIFLELLKMQPRNEKVLRLLVSVYERMGQFREALDALTCLDELSNNEEMKENNAMRAYLYFMLITQSDSLDFNKKNKEIINLMRHHKIERLVMDYLFSYNRDLFWKEIKKFKDIEFAYEILWRVKLSEAPLDSIREHNKLRELYVAKGFIDDDISCSVFELEALRALRKESKLKGDLGFEYRCCVCKNVVPFDLFRCEVCGSVGQMDLIYKIKQAK